MSAEARKITGRGYGIACSVLVLVLLGSTYGAARAGLDFRVQAAIVIGLLLVLAVLSYFGVRAGRTAPFVVTAILLPYALGAVLAFGSAQRLASALEDLFGDDPDVVDYDEDWDDEDYDEDWDEGAPPTPDPSATGADLNGDGIPDDAYSGQTCFGESSGEVQTCMLNGGSPPDD